MNEAHRNKRAWGVGAELSCHGEHGSLNALCCHLLHDMTPAVFENSLIGKNLQRCQSVFNGKLRNKILLLKKVGDECVTYPKMFVNVYHLPWAP